MIPREILKKIRQIELRTNRDRGSCAPHANCLFLTTSRLTRLNYRNKFSAICAETINSCKSGAFASLAMGGDACADDIYRNADSVNSFAENRDKLADGCDSRANARNKVADECDNLADDRAEFADDCDKLASDAVAFANDRNRFADDHGKRADNGDRLAGGTDKVAGGRHQRADAPAFLAANRTSSCRRPIYFSTP